MAVVALAVQQVRDLHAVELLSVPLTFLFANYVEYRGHELLAAAGSDAPR